ncbi:MAG: hypothetical protein K5639_01435 [Eubacterium sp.]|nr:hypothetical protein [Eubacterium sp.]
MFNDLKPGIKISIVAVIVLIIGLLCFFVCKLIFGSEDTQQSNSPATEVSEDSNTDADADDDSEENNAQDNGESADEFRSVTPGKPIIRTSVYPKVSLTWKQVDGAEKYVLYRSKKADDGFENIATTSENKYVDDSVENRKTYYYKLEALKSVDGNDVASQQSESIKTYIEPDKPKTVIVGECFAVALEKEKKRFPSYYKFVAKAGMTTFSILNDNEFKADGESVTALEKAAMYKPDRLVFIVGANASGSTNPTASAKRFVKIQKLMKKINPNIQIVVMAVSPWKRDSIYGRKMTSHAKRHKINEAYKKIAKKTDGIYYCDLTERFEDENGDLKGKYNGGDGMHWSFYAREYMAKELQKWLKKNLGSA